MKYRTIPAAIAILMAMSCSPSSEPESGTVDPRNWPQQAPPMERDAQMEQRIAELLARMTLEEKVGQVIQADIGSVTPQQVRDYNLGSVLNGGNSAPGGDNRAPAPEWLALADEFWDSSTDRSDGGVGIPALWGTDAVHGHSNVVGATLFPHNIGLGAARDPEMMERIGSVTAAEMLATGLDWTFAPTIAVVRNDRWGRTYEGYSEDSAIVRDYAPRIIRGIQGSLEDDNFLDRRRNMLATAKHFVGDGGTTDGVDQGDNSVGEAELRDQHAGGYPPAIAAGVQTVMASFNSWHGRKLHGHKGLLTDVLVGRMGFDGFVVGDWNGHGQVKGCSNHSCPAAFNAGVDMFMAPDSWQKLYENMLAEVRSGAIGMERLDEAVGRILRVKMRAGLFAAGRPSSRPRAGDFALLGAPAHRALAREAVRKSLVLLKNDGILPLDGGGHILVAGDGAHNIGKQSGGWTLSWQGNDNDNSDFPGATSIYAAIRDAAQAAGGSAELGEDGRWQRRPDAAVVVFGEDPYAEFQGDRLHLDFGPDDGLRTIRQLRAEGIPVVAVFLSGRPMWVNPELNAANAFVAAWLPGSEGGGLADVLIGGADGRPRHDFSGVLSYSWPRTATQVANIGDADYDPLFPYGYGLSYAAPGPAWQELPEDPGLQDAADDESGEWLAFGAAIPPWELRLADARGDAPMRNGASPGGMLRARPGTREAQDDMLALDWDGPGAAVMRGPALDLERETNGDMALALSYRVRAAGSGGRLRLGPGALQIHDALSERAGQGWQRRLIKLSCFADAGADMRAVSELAIESDGGLQFDLQGIALVANTGNASCAP